MERKVIGILGGMGPEATADLFLKIIRATPAQKDQDHLRIIVDCHPQIPDRTAAIWGQGPDPLPLLVETALNLVRAGADFLLIPCNTAHHYLEALQARCPVPIVNMIVECACWAEKVIPGLSRVGLLASSGTLATRLYHRVFAERGIEVCEPRGREQQQVMDVIYGVKAGRPGGELKEILLPVVAGLVFQGAEGVILGCTELPLVLSPGEAPVPVLDPTEVLARRAVAYALGESSLPD